MAYDRLACELYGLIHRGNPGDVRFYERECAGAVDVLELGVGMGRLAIPLARAGHQVTGIEREAHMLSLARENAEREPPAVRRRLRLLAGDIRALALGARFSRVLLPNNVLCCLLSSEEVRACLAGVRAHLAPGGRVVLDVYRVDEARLRRAPLGPDRGRDALLVTLDHRGVVYDVHEHSTWSREPQCIDVTYRHVPRGGAEVSYSIPQRFLRVRELSAALREAGLRVVERHGGFLGEPCGSGRDHIVLVAAAAAAG